MAGSDGLTWGTTSATVNVGETIAVSVTYGMRPTASGLTGAFNGLATAALGSGGVEITGVAAGTVTVPAGTDVGGSVRTENVFTLTVVASAGDDKFLNKRGLTHFWENIDNIKQDKLTAGAGISITGNTISATGGGTADAVDWGHITGSMSNQTDLTTALNAKANTADLAAVATSGSYNDLTNKPTVPEIKKRAGATTTTNITPLYVAGDGTTATPMALQTHGDSHTGSFAYVNINEPTSDISEAYIGGYVWDEYEEWWRKMSEKKLALYSDIPTVPTKTSDLTNDSGFLTSVAWGDVTGKPTFATVATSGDYDDLTDKPTIGNATLTIQKNGTSAGTFTANATSNKTINITVPTTAADVSALPASTKYGASIAVSLNTTDYKMTTTLKDQDGNTLGTAQTIDLPLESVVVNGSYDNTNKKIVLTLQNGNTIDIPVADLVAGLQSEITSTNKLASDLVDDTGQTHKFMTSAEKTKLSGIATGAEVNVQSDWNVTSTSSDAFIKNKPTIPTKTSQLTNDSGFLTSYTETDPVYSASPAAGITSTDITNWNNKSDFSGSYADLTNKPTIGNATLTIQKNGTAAGTFTANATTNKSINIAVPTATSDLTNDSGFIDTVDTVLSTTSANPVQNKAVANALNDKVDVASVDLTNQTTTLLAQIKALGTAQKNYGRFYVKTDGGSANISDKPTGSANASFVCAAYQSRNNGSSDYTYQVLCWVKDDTNPYVATVAASSASISWQQPTAGPVWSSFYFSGASLADQEVNVTTKKGRTLTLRVSAGGTAVRIISGASGINAIRQFWSAKLNNVANEYGVAGLKSASTVYTRFYGSMGATAIGGGEVPSTASSGTDGMCEANLGTVSNTARTSSTAEFLLLRESTDVEGWTIYGKIGSGGILASASFDAKTISAAGHTPTVYQRSATSSNASYVFNCIEVLEP